MNISYFDNCYHEAVQAKPFRKLLKVQKWTQTGGGKSTGFGESKEARRRNKAFMKVRDIPDFKLSDIMGQFEMDNEGNFIIIKQGKQLMDINQ